MSSLIRLSPPRGALLLGLVRILSGMLPVTVMGDDLPSAAPPPVMPQSAKVDEGQRAQESQGPQQLKDSEAPQDSDASQDSGASQDSDASQNSGAPPDSDASQDSQALSPVEGASARPEDTSPSDGYPVDHQQSQAGLTPREEDPVQDPEPDPSAAADPESAQTPSLPAQETTSINDSASPGGEDLPINGDEPNRNAQREPSVTPATVKAASRVVFLSLDEITAEIFESDPPSPLDYAVFMLNLQRHQPLACSVVPLWHWPESDPATLEVLSSQTADLPLSLGVMLEDDVPDPAFTLPDIFPPGLSVTGNDTSLPSFTSLTLLPPSQLTEKATLGFTHIDLGTDVRVESEGFRVPLVAQGPDGQYVPSLALVTAVQTLELPWDQVTLRPGDRLQLGSAAPPIPIDETGSVLVPFEPGDPLTVVSGELLLSPGVQTPSEPLPEIVGAVIVLGDDRPAARFFQLPSGTLLSRGRLLALTAHTLVRLAAHPSASDQSKSLSASTAGSRDLPSGDFNRDPTATQGVDSSAWTTIEGPVDAVRTLARLLVLSILALLLWHRSSNRRRSQASSTGTLDTEVEGAPREHRTDSSPPPRRKGSPRESKTPPTGDTG